MPSGQENIEKDILHGTTLRVYRYLFKRGGPSGVREIQRALGLSSVSVAEYHIEKLLRSGLAEKSDEGYTVNRVVWANMIRIRSSVVPLQLGYIIFFATILGSMTILFSTDVDRGYLLGLSAVAVALAISIFGAIRAARGYL